MKEFLQVADQYYVLATSVLADRETRVLKQGETFAIFDRYGDVQPVTHNEAGIFHFGTRHLSLLSFLIGDDLRPILLNSVLRDDNGLLKVEMTNPDLVLEKTGFLQKGTLHIYREKFISSGCCHEKISIDNFVDETLTLPASLRINADFADTFEVRGMKRERRGKVEALLREGQELSIVYHGLDGVKRKTIINTNNLNYTLDGDLLRFMIEVPASGTASISFDLHFDNEVHPKSQLKPHSTHAEGLTQIARDHRAGRRLYCGLRSSNDQFDSWMRRSTDDLVMMTTATSTGFDYPYAGIPWFAAAFGRDGIITALQCLWANPAMARGVLGFLAATQAKESMPERDAKPGKIVHEIRHGEMARLNEIPFGQYYGSIDSTPLFLILCGAYYRRTRDLDFLKEILPAIELALLWVDEYGDVDGDGFIEYMSETPRGLAQQGWKDSHDSVFHADGRDAKGPIALCEVQGYTYMAKQELAFLAQALKRTDLALRLKAEADVLKDKFNREFWMDDLGTYAIALDGDKNPCRVISSNAGQCLFSGIVPPERAPLVVERLFATSSFSGWGVRTIDAKMRRYNPMSYHNGSIWPHDNALIAYGLHKYGFKAEAERILEGMFRASTYMDLQRMPEVFCGFARRDGEAPTQYHHACAPQAWAAGTVYMCLQAILGLNIDAVRNRVSFTQPFLSEFLESLRITDLVVGNSRLDILIQNYGNDVGVQILEREGSVTVSVDK